ncbi:type II toxin-antitoxin system PemK/MazF family toxin [Pseudomonas viridiflava]|uniref:type II toxin-antitoxin system PemK/MazF family toxin n=1 Tax=Pseudomonas viridiflava TaxID=33069 RepID=UPI00201BE90A|nr:type II toxin-antitoxin system PemK/MazF family toxin [Pseudomonas viridiflava]
MKQHGFNRADIVRISLNPTAGREQQRDFRPALVLTPAAYNVSGLAIVAPIIQGGDFARYSGFAVPLGGSGVPNKSPRRLTSPGAFDDRRRITGRQQRAGRRRGRFFPR